MKIQYRFKSGQPMSQTRRAASPDPSGIEYKLEFVLNNPIPAECLKCGYQWVDGEKWKDAIRAPSLENCACFFCWGKLKPLDKAAYEARLASLHLYRKAEQMVLRFEEE